MLESATSNANRRVARLARLELNRAFVMLLLLLLPAGPIRAQYGSLRPIYVGIPSERLRFVAASQRADEWCWAASAQMILNFYGIAVTQEMIVVRVKGALIDQGGSDEDISKALNGWVPSVNGTIMVGSVTASGPPNPTVLLNELSQQHPILLTFATGPSSGHAVVIMAASYLPSPSGPAIQSIVIRDPWPSPSNIQTQGKVEIYGQALANFLPYVRSHWLVSVTRRIESSAVPSTAPNGTVGGGRGQDSESASIPLCEAMTKYIASAKDNFSSMKGKLIEKDSKKSVYASNFQASGYHHCRVDVFSDISPSLACEPDDDNDLEQLFNDVKACIPTWPVTHKNYPTLEQYELDDPDGVAVRLREKAGQIRLWVDAPDKD